MYKLLYNSLARPLSRGCQKVVTVNSSKIQAGDSTSHISLNSKNSTAFSIYTKFQKHPSRSYCTLTSIKKKPSISNINMDKFQKLIRKYSTKNNQEQLRKKGFVKRLGFHPSRSRRFILRSALPIRIKPLKVSSKNKVFMLEADAVPLLRKQFLRERSLKKFKVLSSIERADHMDKNDKIDIPLFPLYQKKSKRLAPPSVIQDRTDLYEEKVEEEQKEQGNSNNLDVNQAFELLNRKAAKLYNDRLKTIQTKEERIKRRKKIEVSLREPVIQENHLQMDSLNVPDNRSTTSSIEYFNKLGIFNSNKSDSDTLTVSVSFREASAIGLNQERFRQFFQPESDTAKRPLPPVLNPRNEPPYAPYKVRDMSAIRLKSVEEQTAFSTPKVEKDKINWLQSQAKILGKPNEKFLEKAKSLNQKEESKPVVVEAEKKEVKVEVKTKADGSVFKPLKALDLLKKSNIIPLTPCQPVFETSPDLENINRELEAEAKSLKEEVVASKVPKFMFPWKGESEAAAQKPQGLVNPNTYKLSENVMELWNKVKKLGPPEVKQDPALSVLDNPKDKGKEEVVEKVVEAAPKTSAPAVQKVAVPPPRPLAQMFNALGANVKAVPKPEVTVTEVKPTPEPPKPEQTFLVPPKPAVETVSAKHQVLPLGNEITAPPAQVPEELPKFQKDQLEKIKTIYKMNKQPGFKEMVQKSYKEKEKQLKISYKKPQIPVQVQVQVQPLKPLEIKEVKEDDKPETDSLIEAAVQKPKIEKEDNFSVLSDEHIKELEKIEFMMAKKNCNPEKLLQRERIEKRSRLQGLKVFSWDKEKDGKEEVGLDPAIQPRKEPPKKKDEKGKGDQPKKNEVRFPTRKREDLKLEGEAVKPERQKLCGSFNSGEAGKKEQEEQRIRALCLVEEMECDGASLKTNFDEILEAMMDDIKTTKEYLSLQRALLKERQKAGGYEVLEVKPVEPHELVIVEENGVDVKELYVELEKFLKLLLQGCQREDPLQAIRQRLQELEAERTCLEAKPKVDYDMDDSLKSLFHLLRGMYKKEVKRGARSTKKEQPFPKNFKHDMFDLEEPKRIVNDIRNICKVQKDEEDSKGSRSSLKSISLTDDKDKKD